MKKSICFVLIFTVSYSPKIFGQGIYFSEPTSSSVYHLPYGGSVGISYNFYHDNSIVVYSYYAKLTYPDGSQSAWQYGETGGWWVTVAGTFQIQGKAYVQSLFGGESYWAYRDPFSFSVIADPPPPPSVYITGPSTAPCDVGTWTANVSGGYSPYTFEWFYKWDCGNSSALTSEGKDLIQPDAACDSWMPINGANSSTLNYYLCGGDSYLRVDVRDATMQFVSAQYFVAGSSGIEPKLAKNLLEEEYVKSVPKAFELLQNYPNPFNPSTTIRFAIPEAGQYTLKIYNIIGQEIATLVKGQLMPGIHKVTFDAGNFASGIYIYKLSGQNVNITRKMILMK
ncbi:T9SS type A sorting domain-containing protein [Melioribacteraceae bacterium 4301-Me]|uniref:T9SS type A sorting domain-containing protein n=1 Tax=Pyranulibacter aquaticus TaxID=3163344 RepID=UPI00359962F4